MEKEIDFLWKELQGLDKEAQISLLKAFAERMYDEGAKDHEDGNVWDATLFSNGV